MLTLPSEGISRKIHPEHRERLAVVYVRQSSLQQVLEHTGSTTAQYALTEHAALLGWNPDRVLVIDEDQGHSAATPGTRPGFERLVTEVSLNHVGLILGLEMSRLARSNKDWHGLLEVCALFRTLLADLDGIYDPADHNDRLLLGLKGTMSEAELHVLRRRLNQGKLSKAQRGELKLPVPLGYVRHPSGEVALDPDEQVQSVVKLIFRKFDELGSVNALLRYFVTNHLQVGMRARTGPQKGGLVWRAPNRMTLQDTLKHPIYAGAYVFGRRQVDPRKKRAGNGNRGGSSGLTVMPREAWHVLINDAFPAYISWEQYEQNQERLQNNQSWQMGVAREGEALLAGLLTCGVCGARMVTTYGGSQGHHRYSCVRQRIDYGNSHKQSLAGASLDAVIEQQVLLALRPTALAVSLEAAQAVERDRADLERLWQQRLERAQFEADRAGRHYRLVEPENRLVARQLASEWETKLQQARSLEEEYRRFQNEQPRLLTQDERARIEQLARDVPALWSAASTTVEDRMEIVRAVIETVGVTVIGNSERVQVAITWAGGRKTESVMVRPVARLEQLSTYPALCARMRELHKKGISAKEIARVLNQEGFKPPKRYTSFGQHGVRGILRKLGLTNSKPRRPHALEVGPNEWSLTGLANEVGMNRCTLYTWIERGWVNARQLPGRRGRWVLWADETKLGRLRERYRRNCQRRVSKWTEVQRES